jgi:hypothetical protein
MRVYPFGGARKSGEYVIALPISPLTGRRGRSHIPRRNYRDVADGEDQAWGQTSLCSMAERVAAAREVTSSLL